MKLILSLHAKRKLQELPPNDSERVLAALDQIAERGRPHATAVKRPHSTDESLYELRVRGYRAIYRVDGDEITIITVFQKNSVFDRDD